jgi:hypothetical protein
MKALVTLSALLLAGCASTENGRVSYDNDGTKVYGLDDRPQSSVAGEGTLMPGAYDSHTMPTGQFTGKERTQDFVGTYPVPPREADPREMSREPRQVGTGIVPPIGAGSLGQSGITPGLSVSSSTLMTGPASSSTANPATLSTAPTLAEPLSRNGNNLDASALGRPAGSESSSLSSDNLQLNRRDSIGSSIRAIPSQESALNSASPNLTDRVRNALTTGRKDSITYLTPDRLQDFEVETVNGNVTLRGTARSETEKLMIGNKVARIEGVRSVNNQLRVISPTRQGTSDLNSPGERTNPLEPEK